MSKYDFEIDVIDGNSSFGKVLERIPDGSTVLECGCATGYMTRFLRDGMGCTVDVIEIDDEALEKAKQWARLGLCRDLNESQWRWELRGFRYDYVLFTDVLEHLRDPMLALKNASDLLEPGGKIIVSIPNICHNDVILNMMNGRFMYTRYGLLDDTHIHFWGRKDFEHDCGRIGLRVADVDRVNIATWKTEQRPNIRDAEPALLDVLKRREDGEVYQWVFVLEKE